MVGLLFIIPAENLEQSEMMTEDNEQEQRWRHKKKNQIDTRHKTEQSEEMRAGQSCK